MHGTMSTLVNIYFHIGIYPLGQTVLRSIKQNNNMAGIPLSILYKMCLLGVLCFHDSWDMGQMVYN